MTYGFLNSSRIRNPSFEEYRYLIVRAYRELEILMPGHSLLRKAIIQDGKLRDFSPQDDVDFQGFTFRQAHSIYLSQLKLCVMS